jgi:hypothetical protein
MGRVPGIAIGFLTIGTGLAQSEIPVLQEALDDEYGRARGLS